MHPSPLAPRPITATRGVLCAPALAFFAVILSTPAQTPRAVAWQWPQFRGPNRDGVSLETGLLPKWPKDGPPRLWTRSGVGRGYSSPIVANGRIIITGDIGDELVISAFDTDGKVLWRAGNGKSWKNPYPGSRATCTLSGGHAFHVNAHGRVLCFDPDDGRELWSVDALTQFQAKNIRWGISECLLVDGRRVIVTPGGAKALMAALNVADGAVIWTAPPLKFMRKHRFGGKPVDPPEPDIDKAGYVSPVLVDVDGRRLIISSSARHFICVDADTGDLLWTQPVFARYEVIGAMPVLCDKSVFLTAPGDFGGHLFDIRLTDQGVNLVKRWETPIDNCHGALVCLGDALYGSGYRRYRGWARIDVATGALAYQTTDMVKGSVIAADARLYALSEDGTIRLLAPMADAFVARGSFRISDGRKKDAWAHPVICDGRLYLRYHDSLSCYDIRNPAGSAQ